MGRCGPGHAQAHGGLDGDDAACVVGGGCRGGQADRGLQLHPSALGDVARTVLAAALVIAIIVTSAAAGRCLDGGGREAHVGDGKGQREQGRRVRQAREARRGRRAVGA